jgi:2-haloacid dehalogenase
MSSVKALLFDVFGTVVDWRSCISDEFEQIAKNYKFELNGSQLADEWRAQYQPSMEAIRNGQRPFTRLDILHAENLDHVLVSNGLTVFTATERSHLVKAWHRLKGWSDSSKGLYRLKKKYIIAPQSNGNISLLVNMAKYTDLPWDVILGAELVQTYKPCPQAYERACDALGLTTGDCMMVAAHNDDLLAARKTGMKTAFILRKTEHGPSQMKDLKPEAEWDICADSFTHLADHLGC